ncbi:MAG TPA: hypothetical protein ENH12_01295 [Proteobacteria bacterium]|nr:hypothetical protein [Pseudomonadota bacterium]
MVDQIKSIQVDPDFRELLKRCSPSDFDGHTEFQNMSPEKRLDGLASLARFVQENKGAANRKKS